MAGCPGQALAGECGQHEVDPTQCSERLAVDLLDVLGQLEDVLNGRRREQVWVSAMETPDVGRGNVPRDGVDVAEVVLADADAGPHERDERGADAAEQVDHHHPLCGFRSGLAALAQQLVHHRSELGLPPLGELDGLLLRVDDVPDVLLAQGGRRALADAEPDPHVGENAEHGVVLRGGVLAGERGVVLTVEVVEEHSVDQEAVVRSRCRARLAVVQASGLKDLANDVRPVLLDGRRLFAAEWQKPVAPEVVCEGVLHPPEVRVEHVRRVVVEGVLEVEARHPSPRHGGGQHVLEHVVARWDGDAARVDAAGCAVHRDAVLVLVLLVHAAHRVDDPRGVQERSFHVALVVGLLHGLVVALLHLDARHVVLAAVRWRKRGEEHGVAVEDLVDLVLRAAIVAEHIRHQADALDVTVVTVVVGACLSRCVFCSRGRRREGRRRDMPGREPSGPVHRVHHHVHLLPSLMPETEDLDEVPEVVARVDVEVDAGLRGAVDVVNVKMQ